MKKEFIKAVLSYYKKSGHNFDGCMYSRIRKTEYFLVFACDGTTLCGKIAENCDDLQCDYEWDWALPTCGGGRWTAETECEWEEQDNPTVEQIDDFFTWIWEKEMRGQADWLSRKKKSEWNLK